MADSRPVIRLYSSSPRRRELMEQIGLPFEVHPVEADESISPGLESAEVVEDIAMRKLQAGMAEILPGESVWGLAADTLVEGPNGLMGKPSSREDAARMLRSLSGCIHTVHSGIAVHSSGIPGPLNIRTTVHSTQVYLRRLEESDIRDYLDTGEWQEVAGAYRIQGRGAVLIDRIDGLWSTVVGLPLGPLYGILSGLSYPSG